MFKLNNKDMEIIISDIGAELKSLRYKNNEYIWTSNPKYWKRSAPFLFPIVGSAKNNSIRIKGKEYPMTQHGFLRDQVFKIVRESDEIIVLENTFNEETYQKYPFKYRVEITYKIHEKSLQTLIKVQNIGDEEMMFNIGGHPAFNCPLNSSERFDDYRLEFEKEESFASPRVIQFGLLDFTDPVMVKEKVKEIKLEKDLFTIDTILINKIKSNSIKLLNKEKKGIEFSYDNFNTLAIWTPYNDAPFICLEPWHGYNDLHNTDGDYEKKDDLVYLKKNEECLFSYTIRIIE